MLALTAAVLTSGCSSNPADPDEVQPSAGAETRTRTVDSAGTALWAGLYRTEVVAEPPQAPTFRLSRTGMTATLSISNTGTLLCPFRLGNVEVADGHVEVQLTPGGPEASDMRRVGCGATGLTVELPDGTQPASVQYVRFVMGGITTVTTRTAPLRRQCRGPRGAC